MFMDRPDNKLDEASKLVIELRRVLDKTQQAFAVEFMKTAITTIARWETSHPPRGKALIRLAEIADQSGFPLLGEEFEVLYADDMVPNLRSDVLAHVSSETETEEPCGYVIFKFNERYTISRAIEFLRNLQPKSQNDEP
jgi:hypothetical protein